MPSTRGNRRVSQSPPHATVIHPETLQKIPIYFRPSTKKVVVDQREGVADRRVGLVDRRVENKGRRHREIPIVVLDPSVVTSVPIVPPRKSQLFSYNGFSIPCFTTRTYVAPAEAARSLFDAGQIVVKGFLFNRKGKKEYRINFSSSFFPKDATYIQFATHSNRSGRDERKKRQRSTD